MLQKWCCLLLLFVLAVTGCGGRIRKRPKQPLDIPSPESFEKVLWQQGWSQISWLEKDGGIYVSAWHDVQGHTYRFGMICFSSNGHLAEFIHDKPKNPYIIWNRAHEDKEGRFTIFASSDDKKRAKEINYFANQFWETFSGKS